MIRKYQSIDREALLQILQQNTPDYFAHEEQADFEQFLTNKGDCFFVAEQDGRLQGGGGYVFKSEESLGVIAWYLVDPNCQGQGIGRQLLDRSLQALETAGPPERIIVRTSQFADSFFAKAGFELKYTEKDFWSPGYDLHFMELPR